MTHFVNYYLYHQARGCKASSQLVILGKIPQAIRKYLKIFPLPGDGQRRDASPPSLAFHFQTFSRKLPPEATANSTWNVNYWAWICAVGYTITLKTAPNRPKTGMFRTCEAAVVPVMPVSALSRTLQGPTGKERLAHLHFTIPLQVNDTTPINGCQCIHTGWTKRWGGLETLNTVRNFVKYKDKAKA